MQAVVIDREDTKCLDTADNSRVTATNVDRATDDDVVTPTNHSGAVIDNDGPCVVDRQTPVFNSDEDYTTEKVIPVEANVVLVSRPGDRPQNSVELRDEHIVDNTDSTRLLAAATADDSADNVSCQSTRALRRPRKRSSFCNNVDVDDGQTDVLTTGRKTSLSHQRHADTADREHRPRRKGIVLGISSYMLADMFTFTTKVLQEQLKA